MVTDATKEVSKMNETVYSPKQRTDVIQLYAAVHSTPQDKRTIIKVLAETFANGMATQAALTDSGKSSVSAAR